MADYRRDYILQSKIFGTRATIANLSEEYGIPDALALTDREAGVHHLQGHYASIVPLAVYFSQYHSLLLSEIKLVTHLDNNMGARSGPGYSEARDAIWTPVKNSMISFRNACGSDIITQNSSGMPKTVNDILNYISTSYGGNVSGGGGGDTVLKRTLKIMGHVYY